MSADHRRGRPHRTAAAPADRRKHTDPARLAAFEVLREVDDADSYANLVLPGLLRARHIDGRDAAFATELAYGTLRMRGRYDAIIERCVDRPLSQIDPPVLDILRLGAHQLLGMRVATHAAVSETVGMARSRTGAGSAQFVNAVLRRIAGTGLDEWLQALRADVDELTGLGLTESHPAWIVRALREALVGHGRSVVEIADLLQADNAPPLVTLVARPGLSDEDSLRGAGTVTPGRWAPTAWVLGGGDPARLEAVRDGRAGVQDEGSQLVTLAFAQTPVEGADERWLDLCAGPGGKAALLGALAAERGARLVANELAPHRVQLVERALAAVPSAAIEAVRTGDGRELGTLEPMSFDRVLVDAPCTGLGALRRRPESRWRRTPADLAQLAGLQRELLFSAVDAVRPGGVVGYVTCSPHLAETQTVVSDVLKKRPGLTRLDTPAAVRAVLRPGAEPDLGTRDDLQLWPHIHGTDAMHLTLLRRT